MISSARDLFDFSATLGSELWTLRHVELDFLELESHLRPQLFTLVDANNIKAARKLLEADVSISENCLPGNGWTPLHLAAYQGRTRFIRMLVTEFGISPNVKCSTNSGANPDDECSTIRRTPLHQAVIGKRVKAVKLLLELGASVDARFRESEGKEQVTALEVVMDNCMTHGPSKENMDIIRVLLNHGADYLHNYNSTSNSKLFVYHDAVPNLMFDLLMGVC
jgi:ankyrin repeat protein